MNNSDINTNDTNDEEIIDNEIKEENDANDEEEDAEENEDDDEEDDEDDEEDDEESVNEGKKLIAEIKKSKHWHHDIKFIDGQYVEEAVSRYQRTMDEILIQKIISNYEIFKHKWGRAFAPYLDDDVCDGEAMHDTIVWKSVSKFNMNKVRKPNGRAFNAYLVSGLLNQLKNLRNTRMSHKNHPRVQCPICGERIYQIDQNHLAHIFNLDRYKKTFTNYPLVSDRGTTKCPITGTDQEEITLAYINRMIGRYSTEDFWNEFPELKLKRLNLRCPVSGTIVSDFDDQYFDGLGYSENEFMDEFPNFQAIIECPFSQNIDESVRYISVKQAYFDELFGQHDDEIITQDKFDDEYPNFTVKPRQVNVYDPYQNKNVMEITPNMLAKAGTTVTQHLEAYATIVLDKIYPELITCPFTGHKTHEIRTKDLEALGKTILEFYHVTCKYPLRKFQVRCAICGEWVNNIWDHIEEVNHTYSNHMTMEQFNNSYGGKSTKVVISTNSYVENDSGDVVHIGDLFGKKMESVDMLEIEDSLLKVVRDDLDRRIAKSIAKSHTVEDVFYLATKKVDVTLPFPFEAGKTKDVRQTIKEVTGIVDFDLAFVPKDGHSVVVIMTPGRQTVRKRIKRMIEDSDISD